VRRVVQQLNSMLVQAAYRNKGLDVAYLKCLECITIPFMGQQQQQQQQDDDDENKEIARIVTQFLGEQGTSLEGGKLAVIVEALKSEIKKS
jgi:hypothetical protein